MTFDEGAAEHFADAIVGASQGGLIFITDELLVASGLTIEQVRVAMPGCEWSRDFNLLGWRGRMR